MWVISLILWLLFLYSLVSKILLWTSIWQQKEYRYDRLLAFLKTAEGIEVLKKFFVFPIKKSGIKRPRLTPKALVILVLTVALMAIRFENTFWYVGQIYFLVPLYVILASVPTQLGTLVYVFWLEQQAKAKLGVVNPEIIGVGGSYGKTTTKILIGALLKTQYSVWVSPKSHNTPLSIAKAISSSYNNEDIVVMEYASYKKGEIKYLTQRYPVDSAVFTGLNEQHLAIFGDWNKMIAAETELYTALKPEAKLFFNASDHKVMDHVQVYDQLKTVSSEEVTLHQPAVDQDGYLQFSLEDGNLIKTQLLGSHYIANIKQAINVARSYNINDVQIGSALTNFDPGEEFIRRKVTSNKITLIIDDRTSNPDGFRAGLELLQVVTGGRKFVISAGIIDLAGSTEKVHKHLGSIASQVVDGFIHTSPIGSQALSKTLNQKYHNISSVDKVKAFVEKNMQANDVLLIEGKLHPDIVKYLFEL